MSAPDTKRKLIVAALFAFPIGMVKLTSMYLLQSGPVAAQAATVEAATDPVAKTAAPLKPPVWTSKQIAAGKHIAKLRSERFADSPLFYEVHETPHTTATTSDPEPSAEIPDAPPPPRFVLQMIMSSSSERTALIDGKPYRVGDDVRSSGWVITSIERDTRSVTLKDVQHDRTITISVELPSKN
jgi:hypothetical protein